MAWNITHATVDFGQNQAVVVFNDPGSNTANPRSIDVTFALVDIGQPYPTSIDFPALIAQAKQVLADAATNAPSTAAVVRKRRPKG